jgi:hypothetical protein
MGVVVPVRIGRRAAAFLITEAGVEIGCLEGVGAHGHPVAGAPRDLLLGCGQEPGAQSAAALVGSHPDQVDVAVSAPRPPGQTREQVPAVVAHRDAQQRAVRAPGDTVMTHLVPLREQGTRPPRLIAPPALLARKPPGVSWGAAAAFPVPALTAEQVLGGALNIRAGEALLIHGADGVTGGLLVALAVPHGAQVIATAGPSSRQRVSALGAGYVIDYHDRDWPGQVRAITGRLATITSDPPGQQRGVTVSNIYVRADGNMLALAYPAARSDLEQAWESFRLFREQPTPELARLLAARHAAEICTGSRPALLQLADLAVNQPPSHRFPYCAGAAAIVGGGGVGVEMASAWQGLGGSVTLLALTWRLYSRQRLGPIVRWARK